MLSLSLCDWLSSCGIPDIHSAHTDEVTDIYSRVVKHYIYHRVSSMISQFTEGLNSCSGLWDMIQSHWEVFKPVMTGAQQHPLTLEEFKQLFTVCYSPPDSPLRAAEEAAAAHWETALALISDGQADFSLEELLCFITGADHRPPLGFPELISLRFYTQEGSMSGVHLLNASTCALDLLLPTGVAGAANVLVLLSRAMHKAVGFTCVQKEGEGENSCTDVMTGL
ncbi:G2/M phase-specific E3 ubiquitin-protein ligase-like [Tautogolabrus adspersus]